jgi:hypothetical protein
LSGKCNLFCVQLEKKMVLIAGGATACAGLLGVGVCFKTGCCKKKPAPEENDEEANDVEATASGPSDAATDVPDEQENGAESDGSDFPFGLSFFQLCIFGCAFLVAMAGSAAAVYLFWRWRTGASFGKAGAAAGGGKSGAADRATSGRKGDPDLTGTDEGETTGTDDGETSSCSHDKHAAPGSIDSVESVYE